jgi:hypothetical protein
MNAPFALLVLLTNLGATLYMTGLIWFVQAVHYPLLARVGRAELPRYHGGHTGRTAWVVAPPMLAEGVTAVMLLALRPAGVSDGSAWAGVGLLAVVWLMTACVQIPCHNRLARGFDPAVHRRLVTTNWVRTAAWSLRGLLVLWMTWNVLTEVRQ